MNQKFIIGGMAALLLSGVGLRADERDRKTILTVKETISVPGKTLPPGKYVIKLLESQTDRNIVEIYNENESKLQTLVMAIPNRRVKLVDKTVLTFWETPSGNPPALRSWFFPDDEIGQEFVYPKDEALQISKNNNNANVPSYEGSDQPSKDNLARLTLRDADHTDVDTTPQTTPPQVASAPPPAVGDLPVVPATPAPAPDNNALVAQNTPQPSPLQDANPSTNVNSTTPATTSTPDIDELPRTASSIPAVLIAGLALVTLAGLARFLRA